MNTETGEIAHNLAPQEAKARGFNLELTPAEAEILESIPAWARVKAMREWNDKLSMMRKPNRALLVQRKQDFLEGIAVGFHYGSEGEKQ